MSSLLAMLIAVRSIVAQGSAPLEDKPWKVENEAQQLEAIRTAMLQDNRLRAAIKFELPAQNLRKMVRAWATQSKVHIADIFDSIPPWDDPYPQGKPVYGTMTAHEALCQMLRGTKVSYIEAMDGEEETVSFGFQGTARWRDDHLHQLVYHMESGPGYPIERFTLAKPDPNIRDALKLDSGTGFTFPKRSALCVGQSFSHLDERGSQRRPVVTQPLSLPSCTCARNLYTGELFPHVCWSQDGTLKFDHSCE